MTEMEVFDLVIIGGGPGGYPLAARMARNGWKVALVERSATELGGTCLNWGCIPTKSLLASAKGFSFLKASRAGKLGLSAEKAGFDWQKVQAHKDSVVSKLRQGVEHLLKTAGVKVFEGKGVLLSDRKVRISGGESITIQGKKVCLAVGSVPSSPGFVPNDRNIFWNSDIALYSKEIPETMMVVGAGAIGMELGQVFAEFGTKVTIVEMDSQILPGLDNQTAKRLLPVFKKAGLEIILNSRVEALKAENGKARVIVNGAEKSFDKVLVATGRVVNHSFLDGSDLEIERDGGFIKVNQFKERFTGHPLETSVCDVYAIGDSIPGPMLAHKATHDAMILADSLLKKKNHKGVSINYNCVPSCVYTYPEIAWVGLNEDQIKETGLSFHVGRSLFSANGRAMSAGEAEGAVKTIFSSEKKLVGAAIWGPQASTIIMEAVFMMITGMSYDNFGEVIHPHPTLSEAFMESVDQAFGRSIHQ